MKRIKASDLTLREKIGQTACMNTEALERMGADFDILEYLKENPFGSMWVAGFLKMDYVNMANEWKDADNVDYSIDKAIRRLTLAANKVMKVPFLPAADAESGPQGAFPFFSDTPTIPALGATRDPKVVYQIGKCIAREMCLAQTRWAWCAVADNASPFNAVMATRCFTSDVPLCKKMVSAYVNGFQSENVAATLKHFPGADKDEYRDAHFSDQTILQNMEEWWERQGCIFQAGIDAGAYAVMMSHCSFPACDDEKIHGHLVPSSMSYNTVTKLLKEKMGFKGVVITDSIAGMRSVTGVYPTRKEMYVKIYNAGVDVVLGPTEPDFIDLIEQAVKEGLISELRIDDACERVLAMKEKLGLFSEERPRDCIPDEVRAQTVGQTQEYIRQIAPKAITWVCRDKSSGLVPLKRDTIKNVQIFYFGYSDSVYRKLDIVKKEFEKHGAKVTICDHLNRGSMMKEVADKNDLILYFLYLVPHAPFGALSYYGDKALNFLSALLYGKEKSIGISIGSQFVYHGWMPSADNFINMYCPQEEMLKTLVSGLYGECEFSGGFPYDPDPLALRA